jgi:hypothetical protein
MIDPRFPNIPKLFGIMWAISLIFSLAVTVGVAYAIFHFVTKYW